MLSIHDLQFSYKDRQVFHGLNLGLHPGEMVSLIGSNGSGKSTLIKLISGVLTPTSGRIQIFGRDTAELSPRSLAGLVAVVPQNPAIPTYLTGEELVLLGRTPHLRLLQWPGREDAKLMKRVLTLTGAAELAKRMIGTLSGGECQRLLIAKALIQEPALLLLDEPTAHLDITYQTGIMDVIDKIRRESNLMVLSAMHDLNLASQYSDRVAVIDGGEISSFGTPREVFRKATIEKAFKTQVMVVEHPLYKTPVVLPIRAVEEGNG